jgi:hypothetical protein
MIISPDENGWSYDDSVGSWKLVYEQDQIVIFEQTDSVATQGTLFVGTKEECEAEIARLGLPMPQVHPTNLELEL